MGLDIRTCVQRKKQYCKGSVTINSSKTKILKFQEHSHNPDSAEAEVCHTLNAMKENIINNFDIPSKVYAIRKRSYQINRRSCLFDAK